MGWQPVSTPIGASWTATHLIHLAGGIDIKRATLKGYPSIHGVVLSSGKYEYFIYDGGGFVVESPSSSASDSQVSVFRFVFTSLIIPL